MPPFSGTAVYVTVVPAQTVEAVAEIVTFTASNGLTVIVRLLEVAGFPEAHVSSDVSSQVTTSLLTGTYAKVGLLEPEADPFTFQRYTGTNPPFVGIAV